MPERDVMETDVLVVGGGPAGLAAAIRFKDLLDAHNATAAKPVEAQVMVVEKAAEFGAHSLSGGVLDPGSLEELIPGFAEKGAPVTTKVTEDHVYFLTAGGKVALPIVPPALQNHGNYVISLNQLVKWLAAQAEAKGIDLLPGFPGAKMLVEDGRVVGVRTGDKGIDKNGAKRANFEAGVDLRAKVTILAEGARGSLTKEIVKTLGLDSASHPMTYSIGLKELWEVPKGRLRPGAVIHTMGFPLDTRTFGGGFIYGFGDDRISIGLVVGLDYPDPFLDPHALFQKLKEHPEVRRLLEGGKMLRYGARTISEGGWYSIPRPYADGLLLVGEAAGYLNAMRLKGIHLAIKTGSLAAETAFEALLAGDTSRSQLRSFEEKVAALRGEEGALRGAQLPPGLQARPLGRARPHRASDDHGRTGSRGPDGALEGIRGGRKARRLLRRRGDPRAVQAHGHGRQAHLRSPDRRLPLRHQARRGPAGAPARGRHRTCARPGAARSTGTPARSSVPPRSTRWCRSRPSPATCAFRSTSRTASTARPATSWIPIR